MSALKDKILSIYNKKPLIFLIFLSVLLGFLTALFANQVSSIIYRIVPSYPYVNDQGMFYYMGQLLVSGKTPYIDFFDHKGPYIFYYTALGVLLGGRIGMMIVQTITFGVFYFFFFKTLVLYKVHLRLSFVITTLFFTSIVMFAQSPSDFEINFPLIMISIYFYLKAIAEENDKYFLYGNIFTGITAGVSIHLRATDAMISLAMVIYFGIRQLIRKNYKNLLINALVCLGGVILASLPPFIHSLCGHFTGLMYEACIINNFKYVSAVNNDLQYKLPCRLMIVGILLTAAGTLSILRRNKNIDNDEMIFYIVTFSITLIIQFIIALYPHYLIIMLPLIFIFFVRAFSFIKVNKKVYIPLEIACLLMIVASITYTTVYNYTVNFKKDDAINEYISTSISKEDRNGKTLCYQTSSAYYINNNIIVGYGDFAVQSNHMPISKDYSFEKIKEYILSSNCQYVIIDKDYPSDNFIMWLKLESGLNPIGSTLEGAKYIDIYSK